MLRPGVTTTTSSSDVLFLAERWEVRSIDPPFAKDFISKHHYAKGSSHTGVYFHGLIDRWFDECLGVAIWLPPTRVAAETVNRANWKRVLSLSRLAVAPGVPKNACSFLLSRSERLIRNDGEWLSLVTYADESQGHLGTIYRAANWTYVGKMPQTPRWIDPATGRQVSALSTKTRTKQQMKDLGYVLQGHFHKHKFVKHLRSVPRKGAAWLRGFF